MPPCHPGPKPPLSTPRPALPLRWTATLLGLLGLEDETLFPRARPALQDGSDGAAAEGGAESAAVLFLPGDDARRVLDQIRRPREWADAATGVLRGNTSTWPVEAASGSHLAVLSLWRNGTRISCAHLPDTSGSTYVSQLLHGQAGLAQFDPDEERRVASHVDPKAELKAELRKLMASWAGAELKPSYAMERLGEQLWAATVLFDGEAAAATFCGAGAEAEVAGPFCGTAASKREAEKIAARQAVLFLQGQPRAAVDPARHSPPDVSQGGLGVGPGAAAGAVEGSAAPAVPEVATFEYSEKAATVRTAQQVVGDQPQADLATFARQLGGFVEFSVAAAR